MDSFRTVLRSLEDLHRNRVLGPDRVKAWKSLGTFFCFDNFRTILPLDDGTEGTDRERKKLCKTATPSSFEEAVERHSQVSGTHDRISDELCLLSAFIVNPVGITRIVEEEQPMPATENTWMVEDWDCGLFLVVDIVKSIHYVRGYDESARQWTQILASTILKADWKVVQVSSIFRVLQGMQDFGWDPCFLVQNVFQQTASFGRMQFESAITGIFDYLDGIRAHEFSAFKIAHIPWVTTINVLYMRVDVLKSGDRATALKAMCKQVIMWGNHQCLHEAIIKGFHQLQRQPFESGMGLSSYPPTHIYLLASLLPTSKHGLPPSDLDNLLYIPLSKISQDSRIRESVKGLAENHRMLFHNLCTRMTKWVISGSDLLLSAATQGLVWMAEAQLLNVGLVNELTIKIHPGLGDAVYSSCFDILLAVVDTSERRFSMIFSALDYENSDLEYIYKMIGNFVPSLLPHLTHSLQKTALLLSSRVCAWDSEYLLVMFNTMAKLICKQPEFHKVAVEILVWLCQMDIGRALVSMDKETEEQIRIKLESIVQYTRLESRICLYTKLCLFLENTLVLDQFLARRGIDAKDRCISWQFICIVKGVLLAQWKKFMCCPFQFYTLGSLVDMGTSNQIILFEPLCLLGKLLIRLGSFHNCIDSSFHPSLKSHNGHQCRNNLDLLDQALVKGIVSYTHWICTIEVQALNGFDGLERNEKTQCMILVSTQLILVTQLILAELAKEKGLENCVIEALQETNVKTLCGWKLTSNSVGLPHLLGGLLQAHKSLWELVQAQLKEWRASMIHEICMDKTAWPLIEISLLANLGSVEKKWTAPFARSFISGDFTDVGCSHMIEIRHVAMIARIFARVIQASDDMETAQELKELEKLACCSQPQQYSLEHQEDIIYLLRFLYCSTGNAQIKVEEISQLVRWGGVLNIAGSYVCSIWNSNQRDLGAIENLMEKLFTVDPEAIALRVMKTVSTTGSINFHEDWHNLQECAELCPLAAYLLAIILEVNSLGENPCETKTPVRVLHDGYSLVRILAKPMKQQLISIPMLGSKARIPLQYAASMLVARSNDAPNFMVTTQALATALPIMERGQQLIFTAAIFLEYTNPAVGQPWWGTMEELYHRPGLLCSNAPDIRIEIVLFILQYLRGVVLPSSSVCEESTEDLMSVAVCGYCITRIASWICTLVQKPRQDKIDRVLKTFRSQEHFMCAIIEGCLQLCGQIGDHEKNHESESLGSQVEQLGVLMAGHLKIILGTHGFGNLKANCVDDPAPKQQQKSCPSFHNLVHAQPPSWLIQFSESEIKMEIELSPRRLSEEVITSGEDAVESEILTSQDHASSEPSSGVSLDERLDSPNTGAPSWEANSRDPTKPRNVYITEVLKQESLAGYRADEDTFSDLDDFIVVSKGRKYEKVLKNRFGMPILSDGSISED